MERLGKRDLAGAVIDSYEAGMQNWTADLPAEFAARRGYALTPYMPAVTRSEEHTSELQSLMRISYAVFCLKKKKNLHVIVASIKPHPYTSTPVLNILNSTRHNTLL